MLVKDHIKTPASAVNGCQLLLLWKSDTTKTMESAGGGRKQQTGQRKEVLAKPREVFFSNRKISLCVPSILETEVKKVRDSVK
jgi:hypothetical protein